MAGGSSYTHKTPPEAISEEEITKPPTLRATRQLPTTQEGIPEDYDGTLEIMPIAAANLSLPISTPAKKRLLSPRSQVVTFKPSRQSEVLVYHWSKWLKPWVLCLIGAIVFLSVLLSAGILQRAGPNYVYNHGQTYDIQVGGDRADTWQKDHPMDPQVTIHPQPGPYMVLGNPSITADFINHVLSNYHSPAAGKGQSLYDFGMQYGIDPVFALAFFMHESSFGTKGEAAKSLSLGNLRCIPNFRCADNFAQFDTWEDGFKAWYQLIRNLYVAQWGLTTVDQIIPKYAPPADNNNDDAYINALKHAIDTWHANQIVVKLIPGTQTKLLSSRCVCDKFLVVRELYS